MTVGTQVTYTVSTLFPEPVTTTINAIVVAIVNDTHVLIADTATPRAPVKCFEISELTQVT